MKKLIGSIAFAVVAASGAALAQSYPEQAVTLVVPYGPGGASDLAGRALAETAQPFLEQPVTVMNKPGAGGMNGARFVSEADADGYTLLLARVGMALSPAVTPESAVPWDAYTFVGALEATPMILAVRSDAPYENVEDLVTAIKDSNGAMTYAASGATAIDGFTTQALLADNDLDPLTAATLVPYKGGGALATALLGGHVDFVAMAAGSLMPHIESGDMKALMVFAPKRVESLPDVATAQELGYEKAGQITGWSALYAPKEGLSAPPTPYSTKGALNHLAVIVDDLDAAEQAVKDAGYTPRSHADYEPGRRFYFEDEEGVEYELVQYD